MRTFRTLSAIALSWLVIVLAARIDERSLFAQSASPDGAELPPATRIVDTSGAVWTIASDLRMWFLWRGRDFSASSFSITPPKINSSALRRTEMADGR